VIARGRTIALSSERRSAAIVIAVVALFISALLFGFGGLYGTVMREWLKFGPLLVVASVAIVVALVIAARPQVGVLVLAALVPYNGLLVIVPHPPFSEGYKQFLVGWIALWSLLTIVRTKRVPQKRPRYLAPVIGYVVIGVISAARVGGTQGLVGLQLSFFYLLIPISMWWCPFNDRDRDRFVTILMFNAFATSLYGIYQQVIGASGLLSLGYQYGTQIRTTGAYLRSFSTFGDQSAFALFLMLALLVCVPVALDELPRLRSKLFLASTPILLLALAFTFSRSAILGLAIGATYLAFHRYNVLLFFAPFVVVALIVLPLGFEHAVFQKNSFQERQQGWTQNLNHAADPFGNGIGTTGSAAEKTSRIEATNANFYQPDNNYYKVLYELGVVGLYFFAATLIACLLFTRDAERRAPPPSRAFISGVTAHVLAVMCAAFTAVVFEIFPDDLMFWVLMGVVASCIRAPAPTDETPDRVELSHA
jgi:hypothetical protein